MNYKELVAQFKALPNDIERWKWVIERKDSMQITCDNDWTGAYFVTDGSEDPVLMEFDDYVGNSSGLFDLFRAIGINANNV